MSSGLPAPLGYLVLWGLIATVVMTSILEGSRALRFSRMSLPFLVGTFFVANRKWAVILGFIIYIVGGWLFAFLYYFIFASIGIYTWWFGGLAGLLHGLFLLVAALPLLPFVHPRMASEYDGACTTRQLEPPGFLAMNYGYGTPVLTLVGQILYGATLGGFLQLDRSLGG